MNEDSTRDMSEKYDTKPTIETVLERISEMRGELLERINEMRGEMVEHINEMRGEMAERFKEMRVELDVRFDRVESIASGTRAEFLTLRADFRELKHALGEHIPALKS